jgi:RNA polymerase sigma factor (sigma-70 family)
VENPGTETNADKMAAFNAIVSEYEGALLRYAVRIVHHHDAAQNVVQDTFIKLFKNWKDALEPSPKLSSWLYCVAHNCAVDHLRREARRHLLHLRHARQREVLAAPDKGPGFSVSEDAERAAQALQTLSLREQQLVILKIYEDKSYAEIGEIAGLTVGNVGYILHHAMRKLAAELRKHEPHETESKPQA